MSPRRARALLLTTPAICAGWGLCWLHIHYGWTPVLLFAFLTLIGWLFGWLGCWQRLADETAQAVRERDELAARLAQLLDGGVYKPMAAHPAFRSKLSSVPKQAER